MKEFDNKQFVTREGEAPAEPWRRKLGRSLALPKLLKGLGVKQMSGAVASPSRKNPNDWASHTSVLPTAIANRHPSRHEANRPNVVLDRSIGRISLAFIDRKESVVERQRQYGH